MRFHEELHGVLQQVAESPKATGIVAAATTSLGLASFTDILRGALSVAAVLAGLIATTILARVNWVKFRNEEIKNRILTKQAGELGIDLTRDEEED